MADKLIRAYDLVKIEYSSKNGVSSMPVGLEIQEVYLIQWLYDLYL